MRVVADASALVELLFRTRRAEPAERLLGAPRTDMHVPALCDVEVAAALRRALRSRLISTSRAADVIEDYFDLPISRHGHRALVPRVLDLRDNFSAYDAIYVALAEELGATFLTGDRSLARAVAARTRLETILC